jgi:type IV pilus assembly protein PilN
MIKINLIAEKKSAKTKPAGGGMKLEAGAETRNLLLVAILLLGVIVSGVWWYAKNRELDEWQGKIQEAQKELARLEEVQKKGDYYKAQKERLERQIQLVTDLKKQQQVPVHILDQVSKNLPDFLWLDAMTAQANQISVRGNATTYNAVSNFYNNLNNSGYFQSVVLGRASVSPDGVAFTLNCTFAPASVATAPAESEG